MVTDSSNAAQTSLSHFVVDAKSSRFTVQAFATGILSAMGHNPTIGIGKFSGEVDFNAEALESRGFRLSIEAASLGVLDDISDKDRREIERIMKDQVLEIAKFPDIQYESSVAFTAFSIACSTGSLRPMHPSSPPSVAGSQPTSRIRPRMGPIARASCRTLSGFMA